MEQAVGKVQKFVEQDETLMGTKHGRGMIPLYKERPWEYVVVFIFKSETKTRRLCG